MLGLCLTSTECSDRSGTASGNCASGFGVCCFSSVDALTQTLANNMTYLQNPGFPAAHAEVTAALTYAYTIAADEDIAQIRLDFHTGTFADPVAATGVCTTDTVTATSVATGATAVARLCGVLAGQHMYVENAGTATTINIALGVNAFSRTWKILVRMIEKGNPSIINKPAGCLQWFMETTGTVSSFNFNKNGALGNILAQVASSYSVCIRPEGNSNCVEWREADGSSIDAFTLDATAGAIANTAEVGTCAATFVEIPNKSAQIPRYCGTLLSNSDAATQAGTVTSDEHYINVYASNAGKGRVAAGSGFNLVYNQKQC